MSLSFFLGRAWAAVSTEGLLIYSLDAGMLFDPFDLTTEVTPDAIDKAVKEQQYASALLMSFQLNEHDLIIRVVESIPVQDGKFLGVVYAHGDVYFVKCHFMIRKCLVMSSVFAHYGEAGCLKRARMMTCIQVILCTRVLVCVLISWVRNGRVMVEGRGGGGLFIQYHLCSNR